MSAPPGRMPLGQLADRLGTAVLLFVAISVMAVMALLLGWTGIDRLLQPYSWGTRIVDPVAVPLAAIAAARLRWGANWFAAHQATREIRARPRWGEEGTPPPRASRALSLFPLVGAAVLVGVFWYWGWWLNNPHHLFGIHPQFGVQRWISVSLFAGVGYFGMILFPRLTASMAGAVAGPTLFAVAGYTLFPSLMERGSNATRTGPVAELAETLIIVFMWGALGVAIAAVVTMLLSKRLRRHPLSYAVWMGALMLCLAVSGTFSVGYIGR